MKKIKTYVKIGCTPYEIPRYYYGIDKACDILENQNTVRCSYDKELDVVILDFQNGVHIEIKNDHYLVKYEDNTTEILSEDSFYEIWDKQKNDRYYNF